MVNTICEYCGMQIDAAASICPHCGAPHKPAPEQQKKKTVPQTIEELRSFAAAKKLPLEAMHVHIGEDYRAPKAFGIYRKPDGSVVVYKNKADGSRAVRYEGTDEAYAVRELYDKMKELVDSQRAYQQAKRGQTRQSPAQSESKAKKNRFGVILLILIAVLVIGFFVAVDRMPSRGYYSYGNQHYYHQNGSWYYLSNGVSWVLADTVADELEQNYREYYDEDYSSEEFPAFEDSEFYSPQDGGGDWDSDDDDDWDWGGGDDGGWDDVGDWDSDW